MFDIYSNSRRGVSGDVELCVTEHGPRDGEAVLLIHGFPDSARLWRHQVPVLVDAGYRVLAPDLRGFGHSNKPVDVEEYRIKVLAADMLNILDEAGVDQAHVVGHDWGAAVAWYLAISAPDRLRSLTALSVGHPSVFNEAGYRQREKSWYMLLFLAEGVAEDWLSRDNWKELRAWTSNSPEADRWIEDLSRPGALSAALAVYRANVSPANYVAVRPKLPPVQVPVLGVWSDGDMALTERQMTLSAGHVEAQWRYEKLEGASHWIPVDAPDRLNSLLLDWIASQ